VVECIVSPVPTLPTGGDDANSRVVMGEADSSDNIDDNSNERIDQEKRTPTVLCTDDTDDKEASIEKKFLSISLSLLVC